MPFRGDRDEFRKVPDGEDRWYFRRAPRRSRAGVFALHQQRYAVRDACEPHDRFFFDLFACGHVHEQARLDVQRFARRLERRQVGVADPLEVVQPVQVQILLGTQPAVGHDARYHAKVERVARQVELEVAFDVGEWFRLRVVGPPDLVESVPPPCPRQKREWAQVQRGRDRSPAEPTWRGCAFTLTGAHGQPPCAVLSRPRACSSRQTPSARGA